MPSALLSSTILARLLEESLDAVMIIDQDSQIRFLNHAMESLSGYGAGELLGQALDGLLPDGLVGEHAHHVRRYIVSAKPSSVLGQVREFAIRHRTGIMIPVELKAVDLGVHAGQHYFGAFIEDLRSRREMEEKHAALMSELERQAMRDPLTGLANRRAFEHEALSIVNRARRSGAPTMIAIADIDHFKRVNDTWGHPFGDVVLAAVAGALNKAARNTDYVGRIGGEEFGLLFANANPEQALRVAERIRRAVETTNIATPDDHMLPVTISIGLAVFDTKGPLEAALAKADEALYAAKHNGRNRVEFAA